MGGKENSKEMQWFFRDQQYVLKMDYAERKFMLRLGLIRKCWSNDKLFINASLNSIKGARLIDVVEAS